MISNVVTHGATRMAIGYTMDRMVSVVVVIATVVNYVVPIPNGMIIVSTIHVVMAIGAR